MVHCACGCGAEITRYDVRGRERKYQSGHNQSRHGVRICVECGWCHKPMMVYACRIKQGCGKFCSRRCRALYGGRVLSKNLVYAESQRQLMKSKGNRPPLLTGENHWNWKGGISKIERGQDYLYAQWRKDVMVRDGFTCQRCGNYGGRLSAHHIKPWAEYPALRYELANGICYCYECHMKLHGLSKKVG